MDQKLDRKPISLISRLQISWNTRGNFFQRGIRVVVLLAGQEGAFISVKGCTLTRWGELNSVIQQRSTPCHKLSSSQLQGEKGMLPKTKYSGTSSSGCAEDAFQNTTGSKRPIVTGNRSEQ
jgi:hypothetical protein